MPTIVFASSKGGAGKSTSAVLLATELAERDATVTVIDADPNRPLSKWAKHPGKPETLTVLNDVSEDTIIGTIEKAAGEAAFVIVDLEGTASLMVGLAMSRADLVIIPTQGSSARRHRGRQGGASGQEPGESTAPQNPDGHPVHQDQCRDPAAHAGSHRGRIQKGKGSCLRYPDPRARGLSCDVLLWPDPLRPRPQPGQQPGNSVRERKSLHGRSRPFPEDSCTRRARGGGA